MTAAHSRAAEWSGITLPESARAESADALLHCDLHRPNNVTFVVALRVVSATTMTLRSGAMRDDCDEQREKKSARENAGT